ncbi:uncharacterized protein LOC142628476, partial [Castanea sativa]|uniref:uncharacterized protein LOC142628476 n=1 Tax=Castanea sativa TaxID=21020 RepID=UPI003F653739
KPKTEPKSSLSDTDSLLQKLHSSAYTTANGDDAEEPQHHLGEHGFHRVVWSEVESLHGPPSDVGCSQPIHRELTFPPSVLPESDQNPDSNNNIGFGFGFEFPSFSLELLAVPKRKVSPHKRDIRNGPKALKPSSVIIRCMSCGRVKLPHFHSCSGRREGVGEQNESSR